MSKPTSSLPPVLLSGHFVPGLLVIFFLAAMTSWGAAPTGISREGPAWIEGGNPGDTAGSLVASDPDPGDTFTFTLVAGTGADHNSLFTFAGNALVLASVPDFEQIGSPVSIRVRVVDSNGESFEGPLELVLVDDRGEDADGDLLLEEVEEDLHGTSDLLYDSDGDGYGDRYEVNNGTLPNDGESLPQGPVLLAWGLNNEGQTSIPPVLGEVVGVAAGLRHSVVLRSDGSVAAWGLDDDGQSTVPAGLTGVVAVAAGDFHSMALKEDGTVVAWGSDGYGQSTVPAGLAGVMEVAAGRTHSAALKSDGTVVAWGSNDSGQASPPPGLDDVVAIAAGTDFTAALQADGRVIAWGNNEAGQSAPPADLFNGIELAAGAQHGMVLKLDGTVVAWGDNGSGQTTVPAGLADVANITGGRFHNLAVKQDGFAVAWGANTYGQSNVPFEARQLSAVSAGGFHNLAVRWDEAAEISSSSVLQATLGVALSHQIVVSGATATGFGSSLLPPELSLDPATGWITGALLDGARRSFKVYADTDKGRVSQLVWLDLADGTPPSDIDLTPSSVMENTAAGAVVGIFSTTDPDPGSSHVFELVEDVEDPEEGGGDGGENDNERFSISGDQLVLEEAAGDFEAGITGYSIRVRVTDGAGGTFETTLSIQVADDRGEDADFDGLSEAEEEDLHETSDLDFDSDNDGVGDFAELEAGTSPTDPLDWPTDHLLIAWGASSHGELQPPFDGTFLSLSAGQSHGTAPKFDGTVVAWAGENSYGQTEVPPGLSDVVAVSAGGDTWLNNAAHTVALKQDGTVVAWGYDFHGQATVPAGLSGVIAVSAGRDHNLALKDNGEVVAWGGSYFGQSEVPAGLADVVDVSAGGFFSVALRGDGRVVAWGSRFDGENWREMEVPAGLSEVVAISAGRFHALALRRDGSVIAWGYDSHGQLAVPAGLSNGVAVSAGGFHSLALTAEGGVVAWGLDEDEQASVPEAALAGVIKIEAGVAHSFALRDSPAYPSITSPTVITSTPGAAVSHQVVVTNAVPASFHAIGLPAGLAIDPSSGLISGSVATVARRSARIWVETDKGRLEQILWVGVASGVPATSITLTPSQVIENAPEGTLVGSLGAVDADAGDSHTFELVVGESSGLNHYFRIEGNQLVVDRPLGVDFETVPGPLLLRIRATDSMLNPHEAVVSLTFLDDRTEDADGDDLAESVEEDVHGTSDLLFDTDGDGFGDAFELAQGTSPTSPSSYPEGSVLISWGQNDEGQTQVPPGLGDSIAIAAGKAHNLALRSNGTVVAWGANGSGQSSIPGSLNGVGAVAAGGAHSLALLDDGTVIAWGRDEEGQCSIPPGLAGVVAIAAGEHHSLALKGDGSVTAWGANQHGQASVPPVLGDVVAIAAGNAFSLALRSDGTVAAWGVSANGVTSVPGDLEGVVEVAAGGRHGVALLNDGTVVCWGDGADGQLEIPEDLGGVVGIAAGDKHSVAITANGEVHAWGTGAHGETQVPFAAVDAERVAAGGGHSVVLRASDDLAHISRDSAVFASPGTVVSTQVVVDYADPTLFSAIGLPTGLAIDPLEGTITGTIVTGELRAVRLMAETDLGHLSRVVWFNTRDGVAPSDVTLSPAAVVENAPAGTLVGILTAIDVDPWDSHTYALASGTGSQDNYRFEIEGNRLLVKEGINVDFEQLHDDFRVRVLATDSAGKTNVERFLVVLTNDWGEIQDPDGLNEAEAAYFNWAAGAGLAGDDALPAARPFGDGVENLLKYAFNLAGGAADQRTLIPGTGTAGLPVFQITPQPGGVAVRLEYVRRKGGALIYTPLGGPDLDRESMVPMDGTLTVQNIDTDWDRVVVEAMFNGPKRFFMIEVSFPDPTRDWSENQGQTVRSEAEQRYFDWAAGMALAGNDALPGAEPFGEGIENLLKYAFNLEGGGVDQRRLVSGTGTAGLPVYLMTKLPGGMSVRLEYLRRRNSGLIYSPLQAPDLDPGTMEPMGGAVSVQDIDADWERVVVEKIETAPSCFFTLRVSLP